MAASLRGEPRFQVLGQEKLSEVARSWNMPSGAHYDVHPEGHRFLVLNMRSADKEVAKINVVLNWFDELKPRVPTGTGQ